MEFNISLEKKKQCYSVAFSFNFFEFSVITFVEFRFVSLGRCSDLQPNSRGITSRNPSTHRLNVTNK